MRKRSVCILVCIMSALLLGGIAYAKFDKCSLCGMNLSGNENTAYEVINEDGGTVTFCCPHCGLWEHGQEMGKIKGARARDFISGEWMDPADMHFVFKSTATPACAPSWIAFGKKEEAVKFSKGFGGNVLSFKEAIEERKKHKKGMDMKM